MPAHDPMESCPLLVYFPCCSMPMRVHAAPGRMEPHGHSWGCSPMGPWYPAMRVGPGGHRGWAKSCDHVPARVQLGMVSQCIRLNLRGGVPMPTQDAVGPCRHGCKRDWDDMMSCVIVLASTMQLDSAAAAVYGIICCLIKHYIMQVCRHSAMRVICDTF